MKIRLRSKSTCLSWHRAISERREPVVSSSQMIVPQSALRANAASTSATTWTGVGAFGSNRGFLGALMRLDVSPGIQPHR